MVHWQVWTKVNLLSRSAHQLHHHARHMIWITSMVFHHCHHCRHLWSVGVLMTKLFTVDTPGRHVNLCPKIQTKICHWSAIFGEVADEFGIVACNWRVGRGC